MYPDENNTQYLVMQYIQAIFVFFLLVSARDKAALSTSKFTKSSSFGLKNALCEFFPPNCMSNIIQVTLCKIEKKVPNIYCISYKVWKIPSFSYYRVNMYDNSLPLM